MADKVQKTSCIIDLPYCGNFFSSEPSVVVLLPDREGYSNETNVLIGLLEEKGLHTYMIPEQVRQDKTDFCEKVCSKIISSRFCIAFIDKFLPGSHDVFLLYGLMLALNKIVIPLEKTQPDPQGLRPLPSIIYYHDNFSTVAKSMIDEASLKSSTTGLIGMLHDDNELQNYFLKKGLRILPVDSSLTRAFYIIAYPMDFLILEGGDYVFFGQFETLTPDEISDRLTLLSRGLSEFKKRFETVFKNTWTLENIELAYRVWAKLKIEAIISKDIDISEVLSVVQEKAIPITLIKRNMII